MSDFHEYPRNPVNEATSAERSAEYDQQDTELFRPKLAGFWIRFWAYMIDLIVLFAIGGLFIKPIFRFADISISNPPFLLFTPYKITILLLFLLYFALMTKYMQQTVGKIIMGIKVVPKYGEQLTWGVVLFREVIGRFISKTLLIPYLLVIFMPKKEALHDLFADTYVVSENTFEKKISQRYEREQLPERATL